jgi:CheY-like chemotaxis protein
METSLLEGPEHYLQSDELGAHRAEILLVEDHADTAEVLRRMLERNGYGVGHAPDIVRAFELSAEHKFDLVISDVGLPDGSGLDLMRSLREKYGLRGIALSGYGMDEDRAASSAAGFAEHLTKPVDVERLRGVIERLVREKECAGPKAGGAAPET